MNNTIVELTQSMFDLEVSRSACKLALKKKQYNKEDIDEATDSIYGETKESKCDWTVRVARLRELVTQGKTQKEMAQICVDEELFGGMASAKQCMPYIKMAQEWSFQEQNEIDNEEVSMEELTDVTTKINSATS